MLASSLGADYTMADMNYIRGSLGMSPTVTLLKELPSDKIMGRTGCNSPSPSSDACSLLLE